MLVFFSIFFFAPFPYLLFVLDFCLLLLLNSGHFDTSGSMVSEILALDGFCDEDLRRDTDSPSSILFTKRVAMRLHGGGNSFRHPLPPLSKVFNLRYLMPETFSVESFAICQQENIRIRKHQRVAFATTEESALLQVSQILQLLILRHFLLRNLLETNMDH